MNDDLFDLLMPAGDERQTHIAGVITGVVTNNTDPKGIGRVKVKFPVISDSDESYWARVAAPMAGHDRGAYCLPEVGDEVLVAFDHGDIDYPYILGALWSSNRMPPEATQDAQKKYTIRSRNGLMIRMDDTSGAEKIEIVDKTQSNTIVIDMANNKIAITAKSEITIEAKGGKLKLSGNGVEISSQAEVKIEAGSSMDLRSSGQMKLKGATIDLN
jgi:uncharacterized protein involved in type VI secretion and phage assembly